MELQPGTLLQDGKYILEKKIGEGGFGITYKGIWKMEVPNPLGKTVVEYPVAVKEFFFEEHCYREDITGEVLTKSEKGRELFLRFKEKLKKEASILLDLDHPHIVNVSEVFEENNTAYMVMEFIDGENLKDVITNDKAFTQDKALHYIKQVAAALEYIHRHNIIHLDVKPANILIDKAGNAKLIDFGIAKQYTDTSLQTQAATVATFSKGYSPIEQYAVNRKEKYGAHTDVYSLGATLYHCLTGEVPTESVARLSEDLVPPSRFEASIPTHIERTILKAMELKHKDRFPSVTEFLAALNGKPVPKKAEESDTKVRSLPSGFKETDTKYIIEPKKTAPKSTQGKKTVISNVDVEKEKVKEKKKKKAKDKKTEQPNNDKLKTIALIGGIATILVVCIFFFALNKKTNWQTTSTNTTVIAPKDTLDTKKIQPSQTDVKTVQSKKNDPIEDKSLSANTKEENPKKNQKENNTQPSSNELASKVLKNSLVIDGNKYYGDIKNGKPDGNGRITYTVRSRVSEADMNKTMAEPGDYLEGKWDNGELKRGVLYDYSGKKKATVVIGKY